MAILGIDIGGTHIKAAPVDTHNGQLLAERMRVATPQPATPNAVFKACTELVRAFSWKASIGCAVPAVVTQGHTRTAANIDAAWVNFDAELHLASATGCQVTMLNDADAAGLAEMSFGAGYQQHGLVFMVTFGTGIGSAIFQDGRLVPNSELGHLEMNGGSAERWAAFSAKERDGLDWSSWAARANDYLRQLDALFWPKLFIIGGGASHFHRRWLPLIQTHAELVPASFLNDAGIVGAALAAAVGDQS